MRSSDGERAAELRGAHRRKVARNEVRTSPLWGRPCLAYNAQIALDPRARASLGRTQRILKRSEPNLLVCPVETLHVSVAWLVAVHATYPVPKDCLWERRGRGWVTELGRIASEGVAFRVAYGDVVATDSAVVALAGPTGPVNRIRGMIRERLSLPPETRNGADLVHTTLFRYRGPLSDPERFLAILEDTNADAATEVGELVVSKELVYLSLETEVLARLPLSSG